MFAQAFADREVTQPPRTCYGIPVRRLLVALACLTGCAAADPEVCEERPDAFRIPVRIETEEGTQTFFAELADTPEERQTGLMHRACLRPDSGMLFLFPEERPLSFWMKNTLIPLDMVFIRADRTVLGVVREAAPRTLTQRRVPGISQFVLELAGGTAEERGIEAGQSVRFMAPIPVR